MFAYVGESWLIPRGVDSLEVDIPLYKRLGVCSILDDGKVDVEI